MTYAYEYIGNVVFHNNFVFVRDINNIIIYKMWQ